MGNICLPIRIFVFVSPALRTLGKVESATRPWCDGIAITSLIQINYDLVVGGGSMAAYK